MSDQKLTELLSADLPLQSTDQFYVVQQVTSTATSRHVTFSDLSAQVAQATTIAASNVIMDNIASPTFETAQDYAKMLGSAGALNQGAAYITDAGGGNINVAAGSGLIRISDSPTAAIFFFDWAASNGIAIPSNTTRYVGVIYNAGAPIVAVHTTADFTGHDSFTLGSVVNESGTLHINNDGIELSDVLDHIIKRFYGTAPLQRDERIAGLIIGDVGTRNFSITAGMLWDRTNEFSIPAVSTNVSGSFDRYYRDGGAGFTKEAAQTQWPNTQYDNGSGTLATMTANRWANLWWYLETDGGLVMLYGRNEYTSQAAAALESPPATVPARITDAGRLVGRFVFQKSASTAAQVDSVFQVVFSPTAASNHASLSNLAWTSSGHTGTASKLAGFDGSGLAAEYASAHDLLDGSVDQDTVAGSVVRGDLIVGNSTPKWARKAKGSANQRLRMDSGGDDPTWADEVAAIAFIIDGAGSAIASGVKGDLRVPYAATITKATLLADQSGSIIVDIWKDTFANYPPTVADKITSSTPPTISANTNSEDSTLSSWTTAIAAGDCLRFNVNATATSITRVTLILDVTKG